VNEQEILAYLEQDRTLRIDMIEAIKRKSAKILYAEADAVLLTKMDRFCLLVSDTVEAGERALRTVPEGIHLFVAHNEASRDAVFRTFPFINHASACWQAYYPGREPIPLPDVCEIKPFPMEQIPFLMSVYDPDGDPKRYEDRVGCGDVLAAYRDGELAGFIGFHGDGSGGMLEVLPKFRRLGIGSALEIALHNLALSRGWTPYGQIYTTNNASRKLQESLGMVVSDGALYWMYEKRD
jgi:tRNA (guanine37-N1)-methyltransferase